MRTRRPRGFVPCSVLVLLSLVLLSPAPASGQVPIPGWSAAGPYPAARVVRTAYPNFYAIFGAPWKDVGADGGASSTSQPSSPARLPTRR